MFIDYHKKNSTQQKGVAADFFYLERMKNFYNCETVKSFLLRLNETLERVSASLARKFIDMLNNFFSVFRCIKTRRIYNKHKGGFRNGHSRKSEAHA